ncbi:hypothetical protein Btru_015341 [Bulinus truncatus]|nr:hypothetical protein Btru_015341 [Bulinus truncatus]
MYLTDVPHRSTSQMYLTEIPHRSTSQKYLTVVPHRSTSQKYLTDVPHRNTSQKYFTKVPHRCTSQKYLTEVPYRSRPTLQKYLTEVLHKSTSQSHQRRPCCKYSGVGLSHILLQFKLKQLNGQDKTWPFLSLATAVVRILEWVCPTHILLQFKLKQSNGHDKTWPFPQNKMQVVWILLSFLSLATAAKRTCYGDIKHLSPTGRKKGGVAASNNNVKADLQSLNKYKSCYQNVADSVCIQASVIAAIASRESRGGSWINRTRGYGDRGRAWGIMQCDIKHSGLPCTSVPWNSCAHIEMMTKKLLIPFIKQVQKKFKKWPSYRQLQGGVAAYNFGVSNVQSWKGLDDGSTGNDYSNDVIARAKWLYAKGWN